MRIRFLLECAPMGDVFFNKAGRLRSGWRVLIYVAAFFLIALVLTNVLRLAFLFVQGSVVTGGPRGHVVFVPDLIYRVALLATALGAGYLCTRWLEGLPWRSLGLTFHAGWFRDLVIGSVTGFAALVVAVAIASKGFSFSVNHAGVSMIVVSMIESAALLIFAALAEEVMFRGYGLQTLSRAKLAWLGVLLTSVPFALAHENNPNVVPGFTFVNTSLAGVWLAVAYLRTRSLWLPLGVHWSWNWALGWFFGIPVSGMTLVSNPLLRAQDSGPNWLTGADYGIEGGAACTIALTLCTIFLWRTRLVSATPELKQMTSEENPATRERVITIRPSDEQA
jgi:membrane protease YdiL (CAAX protease family)